MSTHSDTQQPIRNGTTAGSADLLAEEGAAFIPFLKAVGRGEKLKRDLTYEEARQAMRLILAGKATAAQTGAFLIAQRVKGEAQAEIRGFLDAARETFDFPPAPGVDGLLDLATPYDGKAKTAQLAPAVALVLVAAGIPVLLHGGEGIPTKAGVTPGAVLAALGLPVQRETGLVMRMVDTVGIGYVAVAHFAPAWQRLLPLRRQFGLRTVLNTVEKLFNPAAAPYQISSIFHGNYADRLRDVQTGQRGSWIVQGEEGSIEMAAGRRTPIFGHSEQADVVLEPADLGLPQRERILAPGNVQHHAALNLRALRGEDRQAAEQVALTAGTILFLLDAAGSIADGLQQANKIIAGGAAERRLELARRFR